MSNKVYVIFGGSGGIGSSLARRLSEKGHKVYILGNNEGHLKEISSQTSQPYKVVDATKEESVFNALKEIMDESGQIDGVASLVGSICVKPLHLIKQEEFEEIMKLNVSSAFCVTKAAADLMSEKGSGSIVLSSSTAALTGISNHEAISAAKGAVAGLVRSAAASYASKGVRINGVAPGLTKTKIAEPIISNEMSLKASVAYHPLGRIGKPDDISSAIEWLLSDESSWVTGDIIAVDGGLSALRSKIAV